MTPLPVTSSQRALSATLFTDLAGPGPDILTSWGLNAAGGDPGTKALRRGGACAGASRAAR